MIPKNNFKKISDYSWEIPTSFRGDMRVPARFYIKENMIEAMSKDRSLDQLVNITALPGIIRYALAMPDIHEGYGFPIGGVAALDEGQGVVSPGGVGYDINCGMRLLKSSYKKEELQDYLEPLADEIQRMVPSGLGQGRKKAFDGAFIDKILEGGASYLVDQGFGTQEDCDFCEEHGSLERADTQAVSDRAKARGRDQVGTLGSGNHFCEIQEVQKIFDKNTAEVFGLFEGQMVIMIHTGSRGLGHQIATDYIQVMLKSMNKYSINLPDKELACCPLSSSEGRRYLAAMACGANYAWANRQMISYFVRKAFKKVLKQENDELKLLYDVAHNIAKMEYHQVNGERRRLCVHRKGATRAFPPHHPDVPERYSKVGQPVLVPGSMGTASYVLAGALSGEESFWSSCHGAGRTMSRREAQRRVSGQEMIKRLEKKGIIIKCHSARGVAEEAPLAYKDIDEVIEVVDKAGLCLKVARLIPLAVIKGE